MCICKKIFDLNWTADIELFQYCKVQKTCDGQSQQFLHAKCDVEFAYNDEVIFNKLNNVVWSLLLLELNPDTASTSFSETAYEPDFD